MAFGHASLREDYLNQVQRDFLSRHRLFGRANTPSEYVAASRDAQHYSDKARPKRQGPARTRAPAVVAPAGVQSNTGDSTPSTLCSLGLVVVYCSRMRFSGKTYGAAPKAASAASWKPDRISFFLPG